MSFWHAMQDEPRLERGRLPLGHLQDTAMLWKRTLPLQRPGLPVLAFHPRSTTQKKCIQTYWSKAFTQKLLFKTPEKGNKKNYLNIFFEKKQRLNSHSTQDSELCQSLKDNLFELDQLISERFTFWKYIIVFKLLLCSQKIWALLSPWF